MEREPRATSPKSRRQMRFTRSHSLLLLVLACAVGLIIAYGWQTHDADNQFEDQERVDTAPPAADAVQRAPQPATAPPPVVSKTYVPEHIPQSALEEVYAPQVDNETQAKLNEIKKRYEGVLVTHMFLLRCKIAKPEDQKIIMNAMHKEIIAADPHGPMYFNVTTAATGAYNEMYINTPCTTPEVATLATQYLDYVRALSERYPSNE